MIVHASLDVNEYVGVCVLVLVTLVAQPRVAGVLSTVTEEVSVVSVTVFHVVQLRLAKFIEKLIDVSLVHDVISRLEYR